MSHESGIQRRAVLAAAAGVAAAPLIGATPAHANHLKIYLDPGHGGSDPGATGNGLREKDLTLKIALRTRSILNYHWGGSVSIRMSRTTDVYRSLSYRVNDANSWGASIFVSIHINAGGGTGFESYIYPGTGSRTHRLQDKVHWHILNQTRKIASVTDRGQKTASFYVLRYTNMSAVLTENMFIDRTYDANLLKRSDFRDRIARGHARGIASFFGLI